MDMGLQNKVAIVTGGSYGIGKAAAMSMAEEGARVVIDGLAMGGLPQLIRVHCRRLQVLALVHLLLADEMGIDPGQRELFVALEKEALTICAGVITTSPFTRVRVTELGVDPEVVRSVPPGTNAARPAAGPGIGAPPRLLCVASVTPRKGQDVLVRALAQLADARWSCVCAGSLTRAPTFARAVQEQARQAGFSARIQFLGECESDVVEELYKTSSVFVLPSYYEGYGMVLAEAMVRGLPVVSTTGGAIPYTVPSDAGILVPPGDDGALSEALHNLLSDSTGQPELSSRARREKLSVAARRHALELPDWDQATETFANAVLELTGAGDAD